MNKQDKRNIAELIDDLTTILMKLGNLTVELDLLVDGLHDLKNQTKLCNTKRNEVSVQGEI